MKMKVVALSVLLLAGVSSASLAQERHRGGGGERSESRGERGPRSTVPAARPQNTAPSQPREYRQRTESYRPREARQAPTAQPAPVAPRAAGEGRPGGQRWEGRGDRRADRPDVAGQPSGERRSRWTDTNGDGVRTPADRVGRPDRTDGRVQNGQTARDGRDRNGRDGDRRWEGRGDDRRVDGRRDGDRRDWDRGDRDRRDGDRRWGSNGPRPNHPRWERNRYPHIYQSQRRYRLGAYYPPSGFSLRMWNYGDYLPRAWFSDSYRLTDWWNYDLPMPPPGLDWVRSGPDALLIDSYTGEVVQVVRNLFW